MCLKKLSGALGVTCAPVSKNDEHMNSCNSIKQYSSYLIANMILRTFTRNLIKRRPLVEPINYAVCVDIECTCDNPIQIYPMEVIELACLKVDLTTSIKTNKEMFHSHVRPVMNPNLTLFCQDLTGILQSDVEKADTIEKVVGKLMQWLIDEKLIDEKYESKERFAFASCGNFDLKLLSPIIKDSLFNNDLELPIYFREWINVKKTFVNHKKEWPKGLYHMMELLGEEPAGRLHSAKDDCKNLARIIECLHLEGCKFHVTSKVS